MAQTGSGIGIAILGAEVLDPLTVWVNVGPGGALEQGT